MELLLRRDHGIILRNGEPLPGDVLTRNLLPLLPWMDDLGGKAVAFRYPRPLTWNRALPYTILLCSGLREVREEGEEKGQEELLLEALKGLQGEVSQAVSLLALLTRSIPAPDKEDMEAALERLSLVSQTQGYQELYEVARKVYTSPAGLAQDLELLRHLLQLKDVAQEMADAWDYIKGAEVGPTYQELAFDRTTLLEGVNLQELLASPRRWQALKAQVDQFKARYGRAYALYHASYQKEAAVLWRRLEEARPKLEALERLNAVRELGSPVGIGLAERYKSLRESLRLCGLSPEELPLDTSPRCRVCQVALGEPLPEKEAELLLREIEGALGEQNRRLSQRVVQLILQGRSAKRLESFLKIVQASDLSALANTLDDRLARFIRRLLSR